MVYATEIDDEKLTLQVSGMLWKRSLVMRDVETGTLWSHILGRAMRGKLAGKQLEILPSVMTTWKDWKTRHPDTVVLNLERTARSFRREMYSEPGKFLLGLVDGGHARAYSFADLLKSPVVQDTWNDRSLLVTFDAESTLAVMFSREIRVGPDDEGRTRTQVLEFEKELVDGQLVDSTGSRWSPARGQCLSGKYEGRQLEMLPAIISFTRAWRDFHPASTRWKPETP